jgi:hypothetical protein
MFRPPNKSRKPSESVRVTDSLIPTRLVIWIDWVGSFLICFGREVTFGQAVRGSKVDVPLVADVSRHKMTIRRDSEGYVVDPVRETLLSGRPLAMTAGLRDQDLISAGPVDLRFRCPHPLSSTARVEFASYHRTAPSCDAVLLMSDVCVLGPRPESHIVCPSLQREVILVRKSTGMTCQIRGAFEIDGQNYENRGPLSPSSCVRGDDFSFSFEEFSS